MNKQFFSAKVILFSMALGNKTGNTELITIQTRYPRIIHAEVMTHRVFSRNARSSRAVPVNNLLKEEIYVPYFLKNQSGMQAKEEFAVEELISLQEEWIEFAKLTQKFSKNLSDKKVHKQWANRPLEWFGFIDTLITATEWENFWALRQHDDAQPEIHELANTMHEEIERARNNNEIQFLKPGEWHIPYILPSESDFDHVKQVQLSVARCARVSFLPFDGNASYEKEYERTRLLKDSNPMHASPFEHQAMVTNANFDFWLHNNRSNLEYPYIQLRKMIELGVTF
jgi:hypothetical protein